MANKSYLNFEDELNEELAPYSSITDREPLQAVGLDALEGEPSDDQEDLGISMPSSNGQAVREAILKRQTDAGDIRQAKMGADLISNLGQSFATIAQGSNTPKPSPVFENISRQNNSILKSQESDLDRRQKIIQAIENRDQRAYDSEQNRLLREKIAGMNQAQKSERVNSSNIRTTNSLFNNPSIIKETNKLSASRSVQTLIDSIEKGELKASKNIAKQLTNLIATIELGAPGGVSDRKEMGVDTLYTRAKELSGFISSHPNDVIPSDYLTQLKSEGNALGDRAAKNWKTLTDAALSGSDLSLGNPDVDSGQIYQLGKQRQTKFLNDNSYDPETGSRIPTGESPSVEFKGKQVIRVQAPNGKVKLIPESQVQDAIAHGGKVLE